MKKRKVSILGFCAGMAAGISVCLFPPSGFGITGYGATRVIRTGQKIDIKSLKAGTMVEKNEIQKNGIGSFFFSQEISDEVFQRMKGKSFKEDCTVPRKDLRYLKVLYCGKDGKSYIGEMVCHKDISQDLLEIFRELYDHSYPIEQMVLVDDYDGDDLKSAAANNTSCFNFRIAAGDSGSLSRHAMGKAVDINPLYNPYTWIDQEGQERCDPEEGRAYLDRAEDFPYKIEKDDLCCRLFEEHGFLWGGSWQGEEKDYMHFSIQ